MLLRSVKVFGVVGWYLVVRHFLADNLIDPQWPVGVATFGFWWPSFMAAPITAGSIGLIFFGWSVVHWVLRGEWL